MPAVLEPPPSAARRDRVASPATAAEPQPVVTEIALREPLVLPRGVTEIETFLRWVASDEFPEGLRASLIDGRLHLESSVDDIEPHNLLKGEVVRVLGNLAREANLGEVLSDGAMYAHRSHGTGSEPDAMFNLWESFRADRVRYLPIEPGGEALTVQGAADLVVECVSRSSVRKDTVRLRAVYLAAGVREYWILDGRGEEPTFALLTRTDDADEWTEAGPDADGYRVSPILVRRVRIDRGTNPIGGVRWDVRLEPAAA